MAWSSLPKIISHPSHAAIRDLIRIRRPGDVDTTSRPLVLFASPLLTPDNPPSAMPASPRTPPGAPSKRKADTITFVPYGEAPQSILKKRPVTPSRKGPAGKSVKFASSPFLESAEYSKEAANERPRKKPKTSPRLKALRPLLFHGSPLGDTSKTTSPSAESKPEQERVISIEDVGRDEHEEGLEYLVPREDDREQTWEAEEKIRSSAAFQRLKDVHTEVATSNVETAVSEPFVDEAIQPQDNAPPSASPPRFDVVEEYSLETITASASSKSSKPRSKAPAKGRPSPIKAAQRPVSSEPQSSDLSSLATTPATPARYQKRKPAPSAFTHKKHHGPPPPIADASDLLGKDDYEVDKVTQSRKHRGTVQYRLSWTGDHSPDLEWYD